MSISTYILLRPQQQETPASLAYTNVPRIRVESVQVIHGLRFEVNRITSFKEDDYDAKVDTYVQKHFEDMKFNRVSDDTSIPTYEVKPEEGKLFLDQVVFLSQKKGLNLTKDNIVETLNGLMMDCFLTRVERDEYKKALLS
jgi:hypothetical protein